MIGETGASRKSATIKGVHILVNSPPHMAAFSAKNPSLDLEPLGLLMGPAFNLFFASSEE